MKTFNLKQIPYVLLTAAFLAPLSGLATVAVTAVSSTGKMLTNYYNGSYVYSAYSSAQPGTVPPTSGDNIPVDFAADASPAAGVGTGNPGVIYFNVFSTSPTFEEPMAIVVYIFTPVMASNQLIPIVSYGQQMCGNGDGGNCLIPRSEGGMFGDYFYAATYKAGQTVQLGINPRSICQSLNYTSAVNSPTLCSTKLMDPTSGTSTASTPLILNFALFKQSDLAAFASGGLMQLPSSVIDGSSQLTLQFVSQAN